MSTATIENKETQPNATENKETQPTTTENKVSDAEVVAIDDNEPTTSTTTTTTIKDTKEDKKEETKDENKDEQEEKKEEKKEEIDELTDLSDSDEEDDLISNTEDWDITFKLAPFLDNHFVLQLLKHLKHKKILLKKKQDSNEHKDDNKDNDNKEETNWISLVSERLILLYDDTDINKYSYELLNKTCLIDEQLDLFDVLSDTKLDKTKETMAQYKKKIFKKLTELETICGPLIDFLGEEKSVNDLIREKAFTLESIGNKGKNKNKDNELNFEHFNIDNLFAYCRLRYEIGCYQHTDVLLAYYRMLTPDLHKKNAALWGQLSSQILQNKWDDAFKAIRDIREHIEDSSRTLNLNKADDETEQEEDRFTKQARLELDGKDDDDDDDGKDDEKKVSTEEQISKNKHNSIAIASIMRDRAWLLHWSLFVFFNKDVLLDELIALFLNNKYMNVIQTMCPHLLRYLTSAVLISPNIDKQSKLKYLTDVSKIIIEELYTYRDPITEFVRLVIRTNDFNGASVMLGYAMDVIKCDFFLSYYRDYFIQYARTTFLIKYCKLYNRISVKNISKLLLMDRSDMNNDEIQLWLINAIRSENIDAKLDVVENVIYVHFDETNPYQEMKDRTKSMQQRTRVLYHDLNHKLQRLTEMMQNNS